MRISLSMVISGLIMAGCGLITNDTDYTILGNVWTVGGLIISKIENE